MAPAPQTVLSLSPAPLPQLPSISLLPFSLAFDGPAPISTYFHPRPYSQDPSPSCTTTPTAAGAPAAAAVPVKHRQAAFRGRRVVSSFLPVPSGYQGLVFSTTAPLPPPPEEDDLAGTRSRAAEAREERSAKRAKRAEDGSAEEERVKGLAEGQEGMRRSPRKAAAEARARAIAAAKAKAKGGKGKGKAQVAKGFSLDSDEEQEQEEMAQAEQEDALELERRETTLEEPGSILTAAATAAVEWDLSAESSASTPRAGPAPLSRTSSSLLLSTTPLPSASLLSASSASFIPVSDAPLARDEKHLVPVLTFERFEVWNPDFPVAGGRVAEEDEVARGVVEWVAVAAKIHAY
ncbi:SPOSA6832_05135, partial [Sporobolomyces salmonicolor]|uniref:SPOSA6832_04371-mRNA-1:cds n=1 Tax=Sporidiobolus salmonicolor TaxID=5005 RepID=A0A0D6ESH8_SPOSA